MKRSKQNKTYIDEEDLIMGKTKKKKKRSKAWAWRLQRGREARQNLNQQLMWHAKGQG